MKPLRYAKCKYRRNETIAVQNASMSPTECLLATEQGIPIGSNFISESNLQFDPSDNNYELSLDRRRGQDINTLWDAHNKVSKDFGDAAEHIKRYNKVVQAHKRAKSEKE